MKYSRHHLMTDPAERSAELWRLILGVLLCVVVWFGLARGFVSMLGSFMQPDAYLTLLEHLQTGTTPGSLMLLLALTGALGLGTIVIAETVHGRAAASLFGPGAAFWRDFRRVCLVLVGLNLFVLLLPPWDLMGETRPGLPMSTWMLFLPTTLVVLLVQTGAEEVFFRGYFQSQLAARFRHPAIWLGVPSIAFGLGHYLPGVYGDNALMVVAWSVAFGVAAGDLTARVGNLGPAIALHFVNNFLAIALVSMSGEMSGLALRVLPFGPADTEIIAALLPLDLGMILVSWLAARVALRL
jgi:membrane protease YdiL (CAAX protease family)